MAPTNGRGVAERVAVGATQPEDVEGPDLAANWRKTSRLTVSVGLLSKGLAKRATESPIHLVRGAGAGHEKDRTASQISWVQCPLLYNMPRESPEVANPSNMIESGIKYTEFPDWPSL